MSSTTLFVRATARLDETFDATPPHLGNRFVAPEYATSLDWEFGFHVRWAGGQESCSRRFSFSGSQPDCFALPWIDTVASGWRLWARLARWWSRSFSSIEEEFGRRGATPVRSVWYALSQVTRWSTEMFGMLLPAVLQSKTSILLSSQALLGTVVVVDGLSATSTPLAIKLETSVSVTSYPILVHCGIRQPCDLLYRSGLRSDCKRK